MKISYGKQIRIKCLECSGDQTKEVTLCPVADCALWPVRFGCLITSPRYQKRMDTARKNYPKEYPGVEKEVKERLTGPLSWLYDLAYARSDKKTPQPKGLARGYVKNVTK